jgi:hypothetical protein
MLACMREELALVIEDFVVDMIHGIAALPRRAVAAFREVGRLLAQGIDEAPSGRRAFERELAGIVESHLPVLVHKRAKMFVATDEGAMERWILELHCFMDRIVLPQMSEDRDYAERHRAQVAAVLDGQIAREQNSSAMRIAEDGLPRVMHFGSSWMM